MGNNHNIRSLIPKSSAQKKVTRFKFVNQNASFLQEHLIDGDNNTVIPSIQLLDWNYQCFESWTKADMRKFWAFRDKLLNSTWTDVKTTSGKGASKRGFAMTLLPRHKYPKGKLLEQLSPDIKLFELRVADDRRVHGFRYKRVFHICWLDKNHEICK